MRGFRILSLSLLLCVAGVARAGDESVINLILSTNPHTLTDSEGTLWSAPITYDTRASNWNYNLGVGYGGVYDIGKYVSWDGDGSGYLIYPTTRRAINWSDVSGTERITAAYMQGANLSMISLSGLDYLEILDVSGNNLTTLDVASNKRLQYLDASNNRLTSLTLDNPALQYLEVMNNISLGTLDVSASAELKHLNVANTGRASLDLSTNTQLQLLDASRNNLGALDVSRNEQLVYLNVADNSSLYALDVSANTRLQHLDAASTNIDSLDVSANEDLRSLNVSGTDLTNVNVSANTLLQYLNVSDTVLANVDVSANKDLRSLNVSGTDLTNVDVSANTLLQYLDVSSLNLGANGLSVGNNTQLRTLYAGDASISAIDVSNNPLLQNLDVGNNQLDSIDVSHNPLLQNLYVGNNRLDSLDVSHNPLLQNLDVGDNQLDSLDVSNNPLLSQLHANNNQLTSLDASGLQLWDVNVSGNAGLAFLNLADNRLTDLDISNTAFTTAGGAGGEIRLENNSLRLSDMYSLTQDVNTATTIYFGAQQTGALRDRWVGMAQYSPRHIDLRASAAADFNIGGTTTTTTMVLGHDGATPTADGYDVNSPDNYTFHTPGRYYIQMENSLVQSSDGTSPTVISGAIRIFNNDYSSAISSATPNSSSLAAGLDHYLADLYYENEDLPAGSFDEALVMFDVLSQSGDMQGAMYHLNSLTGESIITSQGAVMRALAEDFTAALYSGVFKTFDLYPPTGDYHGSVRSSRANASPVLGGGRWGGGVVGTGGLAYRDRENGYNGYRLASFGAVANLDRMISSELVVGGAFGYGHAKAKWKDYAAKTVGDSFSGAFYGAFRRGAFSLAGQVNAGWIDASEDRNIPAAGRRARADYDMHWFGAGLRGAYRFDIADCFALTPSLGLDYRHARADSLNESGADNADISLSKHNWDSLKGMAAVEANWRSPTAAVPGFPGCEWAPRSRWRIAL